MIGRLKFDISDLVAEMLDQLPESVWTSTDTTFLDPCMGGGQFVAEIERRLRDHGHNDENIASRVHGFENNLMRVNYAINKHNLVGNYQANINFLEADVQKKFDVIVGNPPYQDGNKQGGQNKIYNQFAKKSLDLMTDNSNLILVTPTSVLKKSKRFSVIGQPGLKTVSFSADKSFPDIGVGVCYWHIENGYSGPTHVISENSSSVAKPGEMIVDPDIVDPDFMEIYSGLKAAASKPDLRMFKQNPVDASITGRSKTPSEDHPFPVFKISNGNDSELVQYNKPMPKLHGKKKFVISMSKGFNDSAWTISVKDFDVNHLFIDIDSDVQADNIISFIFSPYFIDHSERFKAVDGYGFNNALKFLPPFDKTKHWSNDEVREFIESFK